jgi:nicotinate-nucleotide pyrophosphorylase (carboxylating)
LTLSTKSSQRLAEPEIIDCIRGALAEDVGPGDITTNSIVSPDAYGSARIIAKQNGVVSGLAVAEAVFLMLSRDTAVKFHCTDGERVTTGQNLLEINGRARVILTGERTALNFLARMSGIATLTHQFVDRVAVTKAQILDTRKTAPGLRAIDKLAVQHGGGTNHRFGLYDMILIKNNHIDEAGSLAAAVALARQAHHSLQIEVEARTMTEVSEALSAGVQRILLDNMSLDEFREAVKLCRARATLEASGNVNLDNVLAIAETGVDFISVGALTHSARAFDASLNWIKQQ